jgi:hypothetical protein
VLFFHGQDAPEHVAGGGIIRTQVANQLGGQGLVELINDGFAVRAMGRIVPLQRDSGM